jgi:hypothetical protein
MKGGVYILILLLAVISVSAYYPSPDAYFEYKIGKCMADGTIEINVSHYGKVLKSSEIKMDIEGDALSKQSLIGNWYVGRLEQINATGADFTNPKRYTFRSLPKIYTTGKYIITLSWPSSSIYYDNIKFAVECYGLPCQTNDECISQQECKKGLCTWVSCAQDQYASGHVCFKKCEDYNVCTKDYLIDEKCIHSSIDKCCNANKDCNADEECQEKLCVKKSFFEGQGFFQRFWNWLTGKK